MSNPSLNPYLSVDCVVFGFDFKRLNVLLVDRGSENSDGHVFALPGDLIFNIEDLDMAASRVLLELTGLSEIYLKQFKAFGSPDRIKRESDQKWLQEVRTQPEARVVTIGYYSLVKMEDYQPKASSFANDASWVPVDEVGDLQFDHNEILNEAVLAMRTDISIHPIGFELLPQKFTLGQLQALYEIVLDKQLDKRNFRRKISKLGILQELDERQSGVAHKPARFYKFNELTYRSLRETGFENFRF